MKKSEVLTLKPGELVEYLDGYRRFVAEFIEFVPETIDDDTCDCMLVRYGNEEKPEEVGIHMVQRHKGKPIPMTYSEQDCCALCEFVFRKSDYESGFQFYCLANSQHPRPPCGSAAMGECSHVFNDELGGDVWDSFEHWYDCREVAPWGKCWKFERKP